MEEIDKEKIESDDRYDELIECPECGSPNIVRDYERGEVYCGECGLVIDENIVDQGPEWRAFDSEQIMKRARTGAPTSYTIHDKGLSTTIDWRNKDTYGKTISSQEQAKFYRLRKWQKRIKVSDSSERSLIFALSEIDRMGSALGLSRGIREGAALLYRQAAEKKLIRGRSIEALATAVLYATCRQYGVPRTLEELAEVSRIGKKEIGRTYRFLARELELKLQPVSPMDLVPRFCSKLNLSGDVQAKTIEILHEAEEKEVAIGKGPVGLVASAIYIAATLLGNRRTQKEISDVTGVTEVTIRNRYKDIAEALDIGT
ncbi:MAG: transcription initiation factor IIB [Halobacteriota archaeon]|nr:transcription initiation factor IIB [Halobacteriota archaeon]